MVLTNKQKRSIIDLKDILIYGSLKLSKFEIDTSKYKLKKRTLFLMMCAHQSYTEAILRLMSNPPFYDKAAEVLYRSLIENFVNIQYIYSDRSLKNAYRFIVYSIQDQVDFASKYKNLLDRYPKWKLVFGPFKKHEDWNSFIITKSDKADSILKRYKLTHKSPLPSLFDRSLEVDNYLKSKNQFSESKSMEKYYILFYKFFSQVAHLTFPGLERFYELDQSGKGRVVVDGCSDSIDRMLSITYQIYFVVLRFTLTEFGVFNKVDFAKFDEISRTK